MNKWLILIPMMMSAAALNAQLVYGGWGYSANFTKLQGVNIVVNDYNELRDFLDDGMDEFRMLDGPTIQLGFAGNGVFTAFEMSWSNQKRRAEGVDITELLQRREIRVSHNHFSIFTGFGAFQEEGGIGIGLKTSFGNLKIKTRVYPAAGDKADWETVSKELVMNSGPCLKIIFGDEAYFSLDVYYTFGFFDPSANDLNLKLQGKNYEDIEALNNSMNTFGFTLLAAFGGNI
jgi:hypothetical protein